MTPIAPPQPPKGQFPRWIFIPIALGIGGLVFFIAIWQFLTPTQRRVPVAFSDFMNEVHAGRVTEIKIHDREYAFRTLSADGGTAPTIRETIGPVPDKALLDSLKPDDPTKPAPKVFFEK